MQTTLRVSYTGHYRRGLIRLLEVLEYRTGNSACQPVIEALALIRRYAAADSLTYYPRRGARPGSCRDHRGHATRQSLEIYSRLALADAQQRYDDGIGDFPV